MLTERGALLLHEGGGCRLALAVSVDGERIVLVEKAPEFAGRSADRTSEEQANREIAEMLHEM
jgi:hypothetical protein